MAEPEILDVLPLEAIAYFEAKGLHVGFDWRDTAAREHIRSFTVAKVMELDLLADIKAAVDRALAEGTSFEQFRDELEPVLRRRGWWGRREVTDPATGETVTAQLGSPRRLRTIFDANIRTAYARGRWKAVERVAEARPWLRYVGVLDGRIRPLHRTWHGTVLRWDDPWWNTHYPPNGWRCRCVVQQLSDDDLERWGYSPAPRAPNDGERFWTNRRTGLSEMVPNGIDPGWAHNVGLTDPAAEARAFLEGRLAEAPRAVREAARRALDGYSPPDF